VIPYKDLMNMRGSTVKLVFRKRGRKNYTLTGTLYRIAINKVIVQAEKTGNCYHVRMETIRSIQDLETGITVHNFLQDGSGRSINPKEKDVIEWK
jgi:hypothetical protein